MATAALLFFLCSSSSRPESIEGGTGLETVLFIQLKLGQKKNTGHVTKVGAHICNANGGKHINKLWRRGFVCRRGFVRFCR